MSELQEAVPTCKQHTPQVQDEVLQRYCDVFGLATVQAQDCSKQNTQNQPQEYGAAAGCWLEQRTTLGSCPAGDCRRVTGQFRQLSVGLSAGGAVVEGHLRGLTGMSLMESMGHRLLFSPA